MTDGDEAKFVTRGLYRVEYSVTGSRVLSGQRTRMVLADSIAEILKNFPTATSIVSEGFVVDMEKGK